MRHFFFPADTASGTAPADSADSEDNTTTTATTARAPRPPKMRAAALLLLLCLPRASAFFSIMARLFTGKPRRPYTGVAKAYDALRGECAATPACAAFPEHAETDCVLRCLSRLCHAREYARAPLEPGEIDDPARVRRFNSCLIRQEGALRAAGLWPPQLLASLGAVVERAADKDEFATAGDGGSGGGGGEGGAL